MLSHFRSRLSYANVVSTACLFVVLGGTSYAVATGSIDSREIKNNTVRSKDVKNSSLTGTDVKNESLGAADFNGSVQGPQGDTGPQGPKGNPGTNGANGTDGLDGTARAYAKVNGDGSLPAGQSKGIASSHQTATGSYCVLLDASIDVTTVAAIANGLAAPGTSNDVVSANAGGCSFNGTVGILVIVQDPAGTNVDGSFNLAVP